MTTILKIEKKDIKTSSLGENFQVSVRKDFLLIFSREAAIELLHDLYTTQEIRERPILLCKHCGEKIAPLANAKDIMKHVITGKRTCEYGKTMAEC